jgi:uncharacterized lipoprotein YbaY/heat shock protein HslJ
MARLLSACLLAAGAQAAAAQTVEGTATYRERIAPPPDARLEVVLLDVSRMGASALELGRAEIEDAGAPPYAFEIGYDPAAIDSAGSYAVRATLRAGGRMLFTTDTHVPILTRGAPDRAEIVMVRVAQERGAAGDAPTDAFLGGMMTYMADAATFTECMTGRSYPVAQEGDYLALERAYLERAASPGAPLHVHVQGELAMRPAMEGPDRIALVVDRFLRARPGLACERQRASLGGTYWRIDALRGEPVARAGDAAEPHLLLTDDGEMRYAATVGCNRLFGGYAAEGGSLSLGEAAATMMACPPPLDALERRLSEVLVATEGFEIDGATLTLKDASGGAIAVMTAAPAP